MGRFYFKPRINVLTLKIESLHYLSKVSIQLNFPNQVCFSSKAYYLPLLLLPGPQNVKNYRACKFKFLI